MRRYGISSAWAPAEAFARAVWDNEQAKKCILGGYQSILVSTLSHLFPQATFSGVFLESLTHSGGAPDAAAWHWYFGVLEPEAEEIEDRVVPSSCGRKDLSSLAGPRGLRRWTRVILTCVQTKKRRGSSYFHLL